MSEEKKKATIFDVATLDAPQVYEKIEKYLSQGGNINVKNQEGLTPLHLAVNANNSPMIDFLLSKGATLDLLLVDWFSMTPTILERCLKNGSDPLTPNKNGETPLMHAVSSASSFKVIKILLSEGASLDARDNNKRSVIMYAATNKKSLDVCSKVMACFINNETEGQDHV